MGLKSWVLLVFTLTLAGEAVPTATAAPRLDSCSPGAIPVYVATHLGVVVMGPPDLQGLSLACNAIKGHGIGGLSYGPAVKDDIKASHTSGKLPSKAVFPVIKGQLNCPRLHAFCGCTTCRAHPKIISQLQLSHTLTVDTSDMLMNKESRSS
eukprot:1159367-Pelagomonas_calceolata.AAC.3